MKTKFNFNTIEDLQGLDPLVFRLLYSLMRLAQNELFRHIVYSLGDGRSIYFRRNAFSPLFTLRIDGQKRNIL